MAINNAVTIKGRSRVMAKYYQYYIMALPAIILLIMFRYVPMGGIAIAFKDYNIGLGIFESQWAGLKWFKMLFINDDFINALKNTIIISIYKLVFNFPAPIILALLLNEVRHLKFKRTLQTVVYLPHFISWVILGGIAYAFLSQESGVLSLLNIEISPLKDPGSFRAFLVISEMWKEAGWGTVVYLAAISGISQELYEAATIDGANRLQRVIYITLPSISSTIMVLLILRTGHILDAGFDQIFTLYNPLVYSIADILDTYVFRVGLSMGRFSLATAAGFFKSIVGLGVVLLTNWLSKRAGGDGIF